MMGTLALREVRAAVPAAWREATVPAALAISQPSVAAVVSTTAVALNTQVLKSMIRIEGPTIETKDVYVMTRVHPTILLPLGSKGMTGQKTEYSTPTERCAKK